MACYQDLKDYLQTEHIKLIDKAVTEHQNSDVEINGNTLIESLYCTDDERSNLKMELVVSADCNNTVSEKQYYNVTLFGSLDRKLQDIQVIDVKKCDKSDIRDDDLLNHFILPDVRTDDLERIGNELFSYYNIFADMKGYGLSLGKIISNMNAPIFFADLPDDCLGRINLVETDIKIYRWDIQKQSIQEVCGRAKPGVILLNKKKYYDGLDGELLVTVAHELIHWQLHQKFFKLLVVLGTDSDTMNCKEFPVVFSDSMTDIEKALCIAEAQASALAMRLAIPSCTVEAANKKIANELSTYNGNYGDMRQAFVKKFAEMYGVSLYVAKTRNRQLGYDGVDGTCLEYEENGKKVQPAPFGFQLGTLKENETFVIYRKNYEKLMREDKAFAELINSGRYVYLGYVVCLFDTKYIDIVCDSDCVDFVLSSYARQHADECCLKFCLHNNCTESRNALLYDHVFLYREPYSEESEYYFDKNDNNDNMRLSQLMLDKIQDEIDEKGQCERDDALIYEMKKEGVDTFSKALTYIMDKANNPRITKNHIAEVLGCSEKTVQNYRHRDVPDTVENVMLICLACKTGPKVSEFLINKAVGGIPDIGKKKTAYKFLLKYTGTSLDYWNMILAKFELPPIKRYDQ